MTTASLAPTPIFRAFDNNGNPLAGGLLYTYAAGTTTPQASYPSSSESTPNTNPVVLNFRGECAFWLDPTLAYKINLTDSSGNTIPGYPVDNISGNFSSNIIPSVTNTYTLGSPTNSWAQIYVGPVPATVLNNGNVLYYGITPQESLATVTPVNFWYPPMFVDRYGTNTVPGTTDMTTAWNAAISVASQIGGTVTCAQTQYLVSATLIIAGPCSINGGNAYANYPTSGSVGGAQIVSVTNVPILRYNTGSRFVSLENINIVGNGAGTLVSQDAVQIGYNTGAGAHGIRMKNVNIFNAGNYGINLINSISGDYQDLYISGCEDGIVWNNSGGGAIGANRWYNISVTTCTSVGLSFTATNGGVDSMYGVTAEDCNYGIVFASGVLGQKIIGLHTENNTTHSVLFQSGSNMNIVEFETTGDSAEGQPLNSGGNQNVWMGNWRVSSTFQNPVIPRCIQRVYTPATAQVTAGSLSAMSTAAAPTTSEGLQVLSQAINCTQAGSHMVVRAWGSSTLTTGTVMCVALFGPGSTTAIQAITIKITAGSYYCWFLEHEFVSGLVNASNTFTVNVGSTTGSDTVTYAGLFGGTIANGGISIEEFIPSTG